MLILGVEGVPINFETFYTVTHLSSHSTVAHEGIAVHTWSGVRDPADLIHLHTPKA